MQIICARLLQTLCCLFFFVTPAIYSIEFEDYDSWYKIDWQNRRFILTIEAPVAPEHVGRAKGIYLTEQQIERHRQEHFNRNIPFLPIDSRTTIESLLQVPQDPKSIRLGKELITRSEMGRRVRSTHTLDFTRVTIEYDYRIFPDIADIFVTHTKPNLIPTRIGWYPSDEFTGLIIYAVNPLPVHGEQESQYLRPVMFPRIYDDQLEVLLSADMMTPESLIRNGPVQYTDSTEERLLRDRIGDNPLRVIATGIFGIQYSDPIISREDANRLLFMEQNHDMLREGRIAIILFNENLSETNAETDSIDR